MSDGDHCKAKEEEWTTVDREYKAEEDSTVKIRGIAYGPEGNRLDEQAFVLKKGEQIIGYGFEIYLEEFRRTVVPQNEELIRLG
ncbi:hypothetical protein A1F96_06267 [Pyrenophora tritici-repentis]|nr:hypothetical protein A1F96_06267 [Pyrenophora tritici-repentis]